ncbi:hypothetical protein EOM71_00210 [Candidatus Falkowbacteria bacterium]|nr:hypothetical protein [Candidatus Falkowbacteria bacterium]
MKSQIYLAECLEKFYELPELVILEFDNPIYLQIVKDLNNEYGLELSFTVILVAIEELSFQDVQEYLIKRYNLSEDNAKDISNKLNNFYFQPIIDRLSFLNQDSNKIKPTLAEEENIILKIFKENLLVELKNHEKIITALNQRIFALLSRNLAAKKQIEAALLQNQEKITEQSLVINNEKYPGTVTNWLRCFVIEKGADNFNSLSISEFLGLSKNAANLADFDKKVLRSLLNAYRNIKFFPESMPSDDGTDWAIIPLPEKNISLDESIDIANTQETEKIIDPEMQPLKSSIKSDAEPKPANLENINKINQLQLMLKRYESDSLEAQAISEEIAKLKSL